MAGARAWILDLLDAERCRWMLWLPVALGLGTAIYFELPSKSALWLGPALTVRVPRTSKLDQPAVAILAAVSNVSQGTMVYG